MWCYASGLPFHDFSFPEWDLACEAIGRRAGIQRAKCISVEGSSFTSFLSEGERRGLKKEPVWDEYGCSILTNGWTDRMHRSVMNLCVHCKGGTSFIKSIEDSENAHTGPYIYDWVDKCIKDVGEERVIHVVTDNHSSNMMAKYMMKITRPRLFWSSCAAHTIDLMLKDIGKIPKYKTVIEKARAVTIFLYSHISTLAMMRKFTNRRELVRPGVTRFATAFLSLGCILNKKMQLASLVSSTAWEENRWSKSTKGRAVKATIYSDIFWKDAQQLMKIFTPLFKLLRIVDADRMPSMCFVYGMIHDAKNDIIAACNRRESAYQPVLEIIERKAHGRLDSPLHLAAYYLNPYYYYRDNSVKEDSAARNAVLYCIDVFYPDAEIQDKIGAEEFVTYKRADGVMGRGMAERYWKSFNGTDNFDPAHWWEFYGGDAPHLRKMAIKILSLTSSSSGCERNWSVFEWIHTKKRNRLDPKRLQDLVYVKFNRRILQKRNAKTKKGHDKDVLLATNDLRALHWKSAWVKERENEGEEEAFPGSGLARAVVAEASGANDDPLRRSKRRLMTYARRDKGSSSASATMDDIQEHSDEEDLEDDNVYNEIDEIPSDGGLDDDADVCYEDDEDDDA